MAAPARSHEPPHAPPIKIIICCDGTGCTGYEEITKSPLTNVSRVSRCIKSVDRNGTSQVVYYQSGIGTAAWSLSSMSNIIRQGLGIGLDEKIIEAYSFIYHNYTKREDEIYLIGFSRGAFTVRCIAHLIHDVGLLTKTGLFRLPEVFELWETESDHLQTRCGRLVHENSLRRDIRIKACAVWDTANTLGFPRPGFFHQPPPDRLRFVHSDLSPGIDYAFQALSLHEHRRHFLPVVWRLPENNNIIPENNNNEAASKHPDNLEQCWFMGYHADIGGGNKNECLAHFALVWIISKLDRFIDFDEENFWNPMPEQSSWRLSLTVSNEGLTQNPVGLMVQDSMVKLYRFGGSKNRKPRCQFWGNNGLIEFNPPHGIVSNERMHISVRLLTDLRAIPTYPSLDGIQPPDSNPNVSRRRLVWRLRTADPGQTYEVPEGPFTNTEERLLYVWLNMELNFWQIHPEAGDAPPNTQIPYLLAWLQN